MLLVYSFENKLKLVTVILYFFSPFYFKNHELNECNSTLYILKIVELERSVLTRGAFCLTAHTKKIPY